MRRWAIAAAALALITAAQAAPAGWKTYTNKKDGYSISYPADWFLDKDYYDGMAEQGAPHGIGLSPPESLKTGTNFNDATFSVERTHDKDCTPDKFAGVAEAARPLSADGRTYDAVIHSEVSLGDTYHTQVFVVRGLSRCIAVLYRARINDMKRYIPAEAKPFDAHVLWKQMDAIRATLTFTK